MPDVDIASIADDVTAATGADVVIVANGETVTCSMPDGTPVPEPIAAAFRTALSTATTRARKRDRDAWVASRERRETVTVDGATFGIDDATLLSVVACCVAGADVPRAILCGDAVLHTMTHEQSTRLLSAIVARRSALVVSCPNV